MPTTTDFRKERFTLLRNMARKRGGNLLERGYTALHVELKAQCANGHRFKVTGKNLLRGAWCVKCRQLPRQAKFLKAAHVVAQRRGGACLATSYSNARAKLAWRCKQGHQWKASLDNVVNKESWCPECAAAEISSRKKRWWRQQRAQRGKR
jgi:hypothetical protein